MRNGVDSVRNDKNQILFISIIEGKMTVCVKIDFDGFQKFETEIFCISIIHSKFFIEIGQLQHRSRFGNL